MTEDSLQQNVEEIVREAAALMTRDFTVESKGTIANQVTSNDVAVENFLKENLQKLIPDSGFIAEESDHAGTDAPYTWIIDPIDGTANYVRDLASSGISVDCIKICSPLSALSTIRTGTSFFLPERVQGPSATADRSMFLIVILPTAVFALLFPATTRSRHTPVRRCWKRCSCSAMISGASVQR